MQCEQEGETMYPVKSSKVLTLKPRAAHSILRWNEWRRRNDISRKGGEYESAKWFEVGQNGIILTPRPRALSRGILTRPEAGLGNESVTMHCIWNTACRTMHALCCISLPSYGHSCIKSHEGPLAPLQCWPVEKLAEFLAGNMQWYHAHCTGWYVKWLSLSIKIQILVRLILSSNTIRVDCGSEWLEQKFSVYKCAGE